MSHGLTTDELIVVMALKHGEEWPEANHYHVQESVGIASGLLIATLHNAGRIADYALIPKAVLIGLRRIFSAAPVIAWLDTLHYSSPYLHMDPI